MSNKMSLPRSKNQVPEAFRADFDQFMADNAPTELAGELALLRTLYLEVRSIQNHSQNNAIAFALQQLKALLQLSEEQIPKVEGVLKLFFSSKPLSLDDAVKLAGILETISRVADRRKKIAEGYSLKVDINETVLIKFLQVCVLPYVDRETRKLIAEHAKTFSMSKALSAVPQVVNRNQDVIDIQAEVEDMIDGD